MKKYLTLLILAAVLGNAAWAQCDKQIKIKAEKIYKIKPDGTTGDEEPGTFDIMFTKDSVIISGTNPQGNTLDVRGLLKEKECKMNSSFTEGTFTAKSDAQMTNNGQEHPEKLQFTFEARGGKLRLFGEKIVPFGQDPEKIEFDIKEKKIM